MVAKIFRRHRCVLNQSSNFPTKFNDARSICNEMATVFSKSTMAVAVSKLCISDVIDMFQIEVPMFPQILVTIGRIVEKWQQFFEIQDVGGRNLELWLRRFFDVTGVF